MKLPICSTCHVRFTLDEVQDDIVPEIRQSYRNSNALVDDREYAWQRWQNIQSRNYLYEECSKNEVSKPGNSHLKRSSMFVVNQLEHSNARFASRATYTVHQELEEEKSVSNISFKNDPIPILHEDEIALQAALENISYVARQPASPKDIHKKVKFLLSNHDHPHNFLSTT